MINNILIPRCTASAINGKLICFLPVFVSEFMKSPLVAPEETVSWRAGYVRVFLVRFVDPFTFEGEESSQDTY